MDLLTAPQFKELDDTEIVFFGILILLVWWWDSVIAHSLHDICFTKRKSGECFAGDTVNFETVRLHQGALRARRVRVDNPFSVRSAENPLLRNWRNVYSSFAFLVVALVRAPEEDFPTVCCFGLAAASVIFHAWPFKVFWVLDRLMQGIVLIRLAVASWIATAAVLSVFLRVLLRGMLSHQRTDDFHHIVFQYVAVLTLITVPCWRTAVMLLCITAFTWATTHDYSVWRASRHWIGGHTLGHFLLAAALAAAQPTTVSM